MTVKEVNDAALKEAVICLDYITTLRRLIYLYSVACQGDELGRTWKQPCPILFYYPGVYLK
jgi:hypothetical protein